jgi:hypothetical protein
MDRCVRPWFDTRACGVLTSLSSPWASIARPASHSHPLHRAQTLYERHSKFGNDRVRVMELRPWRVLLFNDVEQGLTYMDLASTRDDVATSLPQVLGFDYLRAMVSAAVGTSLVTLGYRSNQNKVMMNWMRIGRIGIRVGDELTPLFE